MLISFSAPLSPNSWSHYATAHDIFYILESFFLGSIALLEGQIGQLIILGVNSSVSSPCCPTGKYPNFERSVTTSNSDAWSWRLQGMGIK